MTNKNSFFAVIAVALMVTAGVGVMWAGSDETEAVTSDTVTGSLEMYADDLVTAYDNGATSYTLAVGSWVCLIYSATQYTIQLATTTYSGYAGLNNGQVSTGTMSGTGIYGIITEDAEGVITLSISGGLSGGRTLTLNIVGMDSTQSEPWDTLSIPSSALILWGSAQGANNVFYVNYDAEVDVPAVSMDTSDGTMAYAITSVTSGYGLSVSGGKLEGTISGVGAITVNGTVTITTGGQSATQNRSVTIIAVQVMHADVRMIGGETWTYTPATNISSVVSISGTATAWVSLTGGTVSGTAPTNTSVGQTYDLTITANMSEPNQTATQTVTFTVDPVITVSAPATETITSIAGSLDVVSSNFEDGTRSIYSLTGVSGYSINPVSGVISYSSPHDGAVTITATSPYTYTSGSTNTATTQITFTVVDTLIASVSGTLYLVTGMTVPNTPAEAVTLSHNDLGEGTYTWAVTGANTSGVTVASDGTLGGTPGPVGTYAVTVTCTSVVDGVTQSANATLNIVIVAVLLFTSSPTEGTVS